MCGRPLRFRPVASRLACSPCFACTTPGSREPIIRSLHVSASSLVSSSVFDLSQCRPTSSHCRAARSSDVMARDWRQGCSSNITIGYSSYRARLRRGSASRIAFLPPLAHCIPSIRGKSISLYRSATLTN